MKFVLSVDGKKTGDMDGYVGFHAALMHSYNKFIKDLAKQCKQLVRHHLDSVTSPYSLACYENESGFGSMLNPTYRFNQASPASLCPEISDSARALRDETVTNQENIPPENSARETTPGKGPEGREALRESQITIPETPSPDQPCELVYGLVKKEAAGHCMEVGARKRHSRMLGNSRNADGLRVQNGGLLFGYNGSRSGSAYDDICSAAAQHFARIREVLVERSVTTALNSGFLTP
ncbi:hypothetical protein KSS87_002241, partial [Heliosperma pusillum]